MTTKLPVSCLAAILFLAPGVASAQCSLTSLSGTWGIKIEGFFPVSSTPIIVQPIGEASSTADRALTAHAIPTQTTNTPYAEVGTLTFDGAGKLVGTVTISSNGIVTQPIPMTGIYTVNPNCTFNLTLRGEGIYQFEGVLDGGQGEFRLVSNQEGTNVIGIGKKISALGLPFTCSNATPTGAWGFEEHGYTGLTTITVATGSGLKANAIPSITVSKPFSASGILSFDGSGHVSFTETYSSAGTITDGQTSGPRDTYQVNSDCTFTLNVHGGIPYFFWGVFVNNGTQFLMIDTDLGNVVVGTGTHQ